MNKLALVCAAMVASQAEAGTSMYIFQPGQPTRVIQQNGSDYVMFDTGGGPVTQIIDMGGVTAISGGGKPTSFIMDGGELGRSYGEQVTPAVDPYTGEVQPVLVNDEFE